MEKTPMTANLEELVENLPLGVYRTNPEGVILYTNQAFAKILGYASAEELLQDNSKHITYLETSARYQFMQTLEQEGIVANYESVLLKRDGTPVFIKENARAIRNKKGVVQYYEGVIEDITERKEREKQKTESEALFKGILVSCPDAIAVVDMQGNIIECNDATVHLAGYNSKTEILGKNAFDLVADEYKEKIGLTIQEIINKGFAQSKDYILMTVNGDRFPAEMSGGLLKDSEGKPKGIVTFIKSIAKRRNAELALKQSEERYRNVIENIPIAIYVDAADDISSSLYSSPLMEQITGYSSDDWKDDPTLWMRKVHPEDKARVLEEHLRTNQTGEPFDVEYRIIAKSGNIVWVHDEAVLLKDRDGKSIAWQGTLYDITKRKKLEEMLGAAQFHWMQYLETSPDPMWIKDNNLRYVAVNNSFLGLYGLTVEQVIGHTDSELYDMETAWLHMLTDKETTKKGKSEREYHSPGKDDKEFWVKKVLLKSQDGLPIGILGVTTDITERKNLEQKVKESEERFKIASGLASDVVYEWDIATGKIEWFGDIDELLGYAKGEFPRSVEGFDKAIEPNDIHRVQESMNRHLMHNSDFNEKYCIRKLDGALRHWIDRGTAVMDKNGKPYKFIGVITDITDQKEYEERLRFLSIYDSLTELYNRNFFETEMKRLSNGRFDPVSIIICDIDGLKIVNDSLGHARGDEYLKHAAEILKGSVRTSDILARIGGDEFAILLPQTKTENAEIIINRIREKEIVYNSKDSQIPLSISTGISTRDDKYTSMDQIFKDADDQMYKEKMQRRKVARNAIIETLEKNLQERHLITAGQVDRLQEIVQEIGQAIHMPEDEIVDLQLLAKVYDLGKVGIPDSILLKQGRLTTEEHEQMTKHSEIGWRIAQSSRELSHISEYILSHHERWDAKGYPDGKASDKIPIESRIIAIADAYDAMTSDRPYRKAMTIEEAIVELEANSGTQFDPELTKIFIRLLNEKQKK